MRRVARSIGWIGAMTLGAAGLWLAGAVATDRALEAGFAELRQAGWQVAYEPMRTGGAPFQLSTELHALSLAGAVRMEIPFAQLTHDLAPPGQFSLVAQPLRLSGTFSTLRAAQGQLDARVSPLPPFALRDMTLDLADVQISNALSLQQAISLARGRFVVTEDTGAQYAVSTQLTELQLPTGDNISSAELALVAQLTLDAPLTAQTTSSRPVQADVETLSLLWGPTELTGQGVLTVGPQGMLEGRLDLTLTDYRSALDQLRAANLITDSAYRQFEIQAALLAGITEGENRIEAPLVLEDGRMFLGPFPLGPAPRLF